MNRVFTVFASLFLFCFSNKLFACKEVNWDEAGWAKNSNAVYVVRITGISIPEMLKVPHSKNSIREALSISRMDKEVSLMIYETLKGESLKTTTVMLSWCGGGEAKLGYVGVLYGISKKWHLKLGTESISATKKALTNVSN